MFSFFNKTKKDDFVYDKSEETSEEPETASYELKENLQLNQLVNELENLKNQVNSLNNKVENLKNRPDSILYYDGTLYVGTVKQDKNGYDYPDGFGTICHMNGVRYTGEWKDGLYDGQGTLYADYYSQPFTCQWVKHVPQVNTWNNYKKL